MYTVQHSRAQQVFANLQLLCLPFYIVHFAMTFNYIICSCVAEITLSIVNGRFDENMNKLQQSDAIVSVNMQRVRSSDDISE